MIIHLQRIYNSFLFHAVILSFLDVLQSFFSNFISFFGTNLLTQCPVPVVVFCLFFTSQETNIKRSPNEAKLLWIFWTKRHQMGQRSTSGVSRGGAQPTRVCLGPRRAQVGCTHLGGLPTTSSLYKYLLAPETLGESMKFYSSRHKFQNHEIQSRALSRHSVRGEHDHGGVHHPHWCLSDDA